MHRFLCKVNALARLGAAVVAVALTSVSARGQEAVATLGVDEIERGQRGYGLSVFEGSEPVRFDVEILGVVRNSTPDGSFVLARLSGQNLEQTGVIAGMSGSPVYIDGRLIGAVAFAWPFSQEAVGGITPIDSMRSLSGIEVPGATGSATPRAPLELSVLRRAHYDESVLETSLASLMTPTPGQGDHGLLWSLAGFGGRSRAFLERSLASASPAGSAVGLDPDLKPGSSVAGVLVDGDLRVAVTGTVTERLGDEILAFGHQFLGQGPINMPMATSEVVTVLSSQLSSFKIANVGEIVGAFDLDRVSGVRGRLGAAVDMIPMSVEISGMAEKGYRMKLADVPAYIPTMVAVASLGAMDAVSRSGGVQGIDLTATWHLARYGEVTVSQSFDGAGAGFSAAIYTLLMTNYLVNNPVEATRLEGVEVSIEQHPRIRSERVVGGFSNRAIVAPGATVGVTLEIQPYQDEPYQRQLELELPRDLPAGRYSIVVGDGVTVDAVRQIVEQVIPVTLAQSLDLVRGFHSSRDLVAVGLVPAPGLTFSGRVLPQLPGSIRQLWGPVPPGGATALGLAVVQEWVEPLEHPLYGGLRIDFEVERATTTRMNPSSPASARGRWMSDLTPGQGVLLTLETAESVLGGSRHEDSALMSRKKEPK